MRCWLFRFTTLRESRLTKASHRQRPPTRNGRSSLWNQRVAVTPRTCISTSTEPSRRQEQAIRRRLRTSDMAIPSTALPFFLNTKTKQMSRKLRVLEEFRTEKAGRPERDLAGPCPEGRPHERRCRSGAGRGFRGRWPRRGRRERDVRRCIAAMSMASGGRA